MKNYFWWTSCRSGWSGQRFPSTSHLMFSIAMRQGKNVLECHTHPLQWSAGMSSHAAFMHPTETSDLVVYDHILSTSILKEMVVIVLWAIYIYDDDEWCIYITLFVLCCTPKALYSHVGGLSSTTTSVQHPLGWCDGCHRTTAPVRSPHTRYRWREERVIEPIKWMGIIRRPWLTRASGGNLARTPGLHPTLYEKCHGIFNDHRESGPRFNVSSERRCLLTV